MRATGEPFCLLDKDTLYGGYSAAAMGALTGDPNDRDSPLFLQHLRDPEYRGAHRYGAREPGTRRQRGGGRAALARSARRAALRPAWLGIGDTVTIRVVWVQVTEDVAHARIVARGNPNDAYKLAHWDEYRQRRFVPSGDQCRDLLRFDNSAPSNEAYDELLARLVSS